MTRHQPLWHLSIQSRSAVGGVILDLTQVKVVELNSLEASYSSSKTCLHKELVIHGRLKWHPIGTVIRIALSTFLVVLHSLLVIRSQVLIHSIALCKLLNHFHLCVLSHAFVGHGSLRCCIRAWPGRGLANSLCPLASSRPRGPRDFVALLVSQQLVVGCMTPAPPACKYSWIFSSCCHSHALCLDAVICQINRATILVPSKPCTVVHFAFASPPAKGIYSVLPLDVAS
mmetsp:Transcript_21961/g.40357  ORF Transcript_21961/g.40357 Transcript_21961/m.40357 type:complete len:229 (-) Transcript_21961:240-926(-)